MTERQSSQPAKAHLSARPLVAMTTSAAASCLQFGQTAVGSIPPHQQYLLSMLVVLINTAGCPLPGPELFIHTHTHTQGPASEEKLASCFLCLHPSSLVLPFCLLAEGISSFPLLSLFSLSLCLSLPLSFNLLLTRVPTQILARSAHPPCVFYFPVVALAVLSALATLAGRQCVCMR